MSWPILPTITSSSVLSDFNAAMDKYAPGLRHKDTFSTFAVHTPVAC